MAERAELPGEVAAAGAAPLGEVAESTEPPGEAAATTSEPPGKVAESTEPPWEVAESTELPGEVAESTEPPGDGMAAAARPFKVMEVVSVDVVLPAQFPVVTLHEVEAPFRDLVFPIGMAEGVALAYALRRLPTSRPLTHELLASVLQRLRVDLVAVRLVGRTGGTYVAELDLMSAAGREVVSCRPSDGLVLAVRAPVPVPVLADARLMDHDGDVDP